MFLVFNTYCLFNLWFSVYFTCFKKANSKTSLIIPIITFAPLIIAGSIANLVSVSRAESYARYFNQPLTQDP